MDKRIREAIKLSRYIHDGLSDDGTSVADAELEQWLASSDKHKEIYHRVMNNDDMAERLEFYDSIDTHEEWRLFEMRRKASVRTHKHKFHLLSSYRSIAAIAATLLVPLFILFLTLSKGVDVPNYALLDGKSVPPGVTRAVLTIDNATVAIDETMVVTTDEGVCVKDKTGMPLVANTGASDKSCCLTVPIGGEYYLELQDGTRVWLGSDSELVFPEQFASDKRCVAIRGEAYLEVAHNADWPFYVDLGAVNVHVTGTAFSISNFDMNDLMMVALAEGGVRMEDKKGELLAVLSPAKGFVRDNATGRFELQDVDVQTITALKHGLFVFEEEPLTQIVERLQRWYNIEIEVESSLRNHCYSGVLNKHKSIEGIINILDKTKELKFVIDDAGVIKIIPMNYK